MTGDELSESSRVFLPGQSFFSVAKRMSLTATQGTDVLSKTVPRVSTTGMAWLDL